MLYLSVSVVPDAILHMMCDMQPLQSRCYMSVLTQVLAVVAASIICATLIEYANARYFHNVMFAAYWRGIKWESKFSAWHIVITSTTFALALHLLTENCFKSAIAVIIGGVFLRTFWPILRFYFPGFLKWLVNYKHSR